MKPWVKVFLVTALFAIAAVVLAFSLLTMLRPGESGVETGGGAARVR
jgi:hypothetical protein